MSSLRPFSNPIASTVETRSRGARLHGLDALRAVAAVLVVLLHAATPYIRHPMPGLVWPVRGETSSSVVDGLFWAIEGCVMPLFFTMAGFVAAGLLASLGRREFVAHRVKRLLLPLLFGCVVILPCDLYVWLLGCLLDGRCTVREILRLKFEGEFQSNLWGFSHLWFLQYLFLYSGGLAAAGWVSDRFRRRDVLPLWAATSSSLASRSLRWWSRPLLVAGPVGVVLWFEPEVVLGFQHSFLPVPAKFLHGAIFFAAGVWMSGARGQIELLTRHSGWYLGLAVAAFAAVLPLSHDYLSGGLDGWERTALAAGMALFAALAVLGLCGRFLVWFSQPHAALQYVAAASFWIYLVHHPVVGLTQIDLVQVAMPAGVKFVVTAAVALGFSLLTYEAFVRRTWVGVLLNGRRKPAAPAKSDVRPAAAPAKAA